MIVPRMVRCEQCSKSEEINARAGSDDPLYAWPHPADTKWTKLKFRFGRPLDFCSTACLHNWAAIHDAEATP